MNLIKFHKKSVIEEDIVKKFNGKTYREISELTGINVTRVHRIFTYGGMKVCELELFIKALEGKSCLKK